ncbi:ATP-dependent RNA helicase [Novymonas esmeraldas]|uniref:ATP-dependent RNA helicase n=1 Tax=Novymonas esmeraldas TaxID=1808958 RepID=A0AAW0EUR3_9TRYP
MQQQQQHHSAVTPLFLYLSPVDRCPPLHRINLTAPTLYSVFSLSLDECVCVCAQERRNDTSAAGDANRDRVCMCVCVSARERGERSLCRPPLLHLRRDDLLLSSPPATPCTRFSAWCRLVGQRPHTRPPLLPPLSLLLLLSRESMNMCTPACARRRRLSHAVEAVALHTHTHTHTHTRTRSGDFPVLLISVLFFFVVSRCCSRPLSLSLPLHLHILSLTLSLSLCVSSVRGLPSLVSWTLIIEGEPSIAAQGRRHRPPPPLPHHSSASLALSLTHIAAMPRRSGPQIKRAGDAKGADGGGGRTEGAKTTAPPAAVDEQWSATRQGGNVLQWLAQKTDAAAPAATSRGAVEYLSQAKKPKSYAAAAAAAAATASATAPTPAGGGGGGAKAKPHAAQTAEKSVAKAPQSAPAKGGKRDAAPREAVAPPASPPPPEASKPATRPTTAPASAAASAVPKPRSRVAPAPATPVSTPPTAPAVNVASDAVGTLAQLFPAKTTAAPAAAAAASSAEVPPEATTTTVEATAAEAPPPTAAVAPARPLPRSMAATAAGAARPDAPTARRVRGRRRDDDRAARAQQRIEKEQEEAQKQHEEAMRTDAAYKQRFESMQEMQAAMHASQAEFFNKYSRQETLLLSHVVVERLDMPVILDLIEQHDVVFICTDTGSGKSTGVPKALLELSPDTRVVSTQPRRTATVAIANRVASLRRERVGEDVGYWIRGDKKGDEQTRLWYMTSYTLLLRILENPAELPFTHIVLDEFHERQPDLEVTVALLRLALLHKTSPFKLVLMSATLNTEDWEEYFSGLRVATYKQSESEHPIHDYFLEETCTLLGSDYLAPPQLVSRGIVDKMTVDKHFYIAQNLILFLNSCANPVHSILVFLPGRAQVETMSTWLRTQLSHRVDAVPWHSAVDLSEIEAAMKRHIPGRQKVYLATDIAEVSITLPDVVCVVDLVLVKRPKISRESPASIQYPPLVTQWISRGSVAQRRGRIGRVQQGFYFCLFPAAQITDLPAYSQPPIENSRIDEISLHCLQVVNNPVAIFSLCHGQPLVETIASAMNTLTQLGCILDAKDPLSAGERVEEIYNSQNQSWSRMIMAAAEAEAAADIPEYQYTFVGRILQLIPVSPQPGMLVFFGFLTGLESLMILAAAVTSSLSPFSINTGDGRQRHFNIARAMEETENAMRDLCCGLRSDIVAVMKATLLFRVEQQRHGDSVQTLRQWCLQKHLSYDKLMAIVDLESHIKYELAEFVPFRNIVEAEKLLEQLDKLASMVAVMTNVAFVAQSLEVTSEGNTYANTKETALGLFSDLTAVPDIHSPSCLRWQEGDIIIPVQLNLMFDKLLASFSTAIASPKQFWMSLLLFSQRVQYATFSDDEGTFHVFALSYGGKERYVEVDEIAGLVLLEFRRKLSTICEVLRLTHANRHLYEEDFSALLSSYSLPPLQELQRDVITALVSIFNNLEDMTADEVEHDEDDLDAVSLLSFALRAHTS